METPRSLFLFLFLFHAFLLASAQKGDALIRATCKSTNFFNLCVSTLESDPRSLKSDVKGLADITLEIALSKNNQTLNIIGKIFNNTMIPDLFRILGTCIEEYSRSVTETLPQAIKALKSNKYGAAIQGARDVATSVNICERQFAANESPVAKEDRLVQGLALVASSIISKLG